MQKMPLNPNATPWTVPETRMDPAMDISASMAPHDHRFHDYSQFYHAQHAHAMLPGMMAHPMPRHMQGHGGYMNANAMPPIPHNEPIQPYNNPRARQPQYNAGTMHPTHFAVPQSYKKTKPVVVAVFGYRRTGKTSVARRLSEALNYKYVSLKSKDKSATLSPNAFVAPLVGLLACKNSFDGIVIDDVVLRNKFEPYYVHSVLQKHELKFDVVVFLDCDLDNTGEKGIDYDDPLQRQLHPESYEFCANYILGESVIIVDCRNKGLDAIIFETIKKIEPNGKKESLLKLKEVELMPKCLLEQDPEFLTTILEAQNQKLNLHEGTSFPFSEPNYLLEYAAFARHAYAFRSYLITPWIQGDKVSLIGYKDAVYIHLPTYNIVFHFANAPSTLLQLEKEKMGDNEIRFIFEATFARDKLYISEMLLLGDKKGSEMLVYERVELLKESLKGMNSTTVQLLPWYPVHSIESCEAENPEASGILFVNPDGVMFGEYNSRNFLYPLQRKKSVELRIWNGSFNGGLWTFDAYCVEMDKEVLIEGVPVHVPDAVVTDHCINDGNILECLREDYHGGMTKNKKGAKHFVFHDRCKWLLKPTTVYKQGFFVSEPKWPLERMAQACASIKHVPAVRPEEAKTDDE